MQHTRSTAPERGGPVLGQQAVMLKRSLNSSLPTYRRSPLHVEVIPLWRLHPDISKTSDEWSSSRGQKRARPPSPSRVWKRPKPTRKPRKDRNKSSENTPVQSDNPVSNSPTSGVNQPLPVVATSGIVGTIVPPEESGTQLHELEQYVSAYGRVVSMKYIPGTTKVFPITPLTTQRLGTRSMNNQVHKVLRENHKGRWSPRIDNSEDITPKNVSTPSDRGTPAKLLVEREKLPARGPYVPHEDLRGVRIPQWFLNYELRTPADVLFLHKLVVAYQMPQKGDPEWYGFKETSLDIVKALTGNF